ncbi:MAG: hypothetical protein WEB37_08040 [Bacteroidota bacterium]
MRATTRIHYDYSSNPDNLVVDIFASATVAPDTMCSGKGTSLDSGHIRQSDRLRAVPGDRASLAQEAVFLENNIVNVCFI